MPEHRPPIQAEDVPQRWRALLASVTGPSVLRALDGDR